MMCLRNVWHNRSRAILSPLIRYNIALANEAMDARRSWTSTITASATSSQAIEAGIHNEMKPMMPSTRWGSNGLIEETGGVIATPSSKRKVINAEESSNDSDGNESYYSC